MWASSMSHTHKVHTDTVEPTISIDAIKADLAALFMASLSESFDLPAALLITWVWIGCLQVALQYDSL